jgi:heme/copper-type cytochrome/quinol oxidase subunit 3
MTVEITILLLSAVVMSITQVVKKIGGEKAIKVIPVIAIILGLLFSFLFQYNVDLLQTILVGLIIGLSATGFYENTLNKINFDKKG